MFINKHMAARPHILFTLLYRNYRVRTRFVVLICRKNMHRTELRTNHLIGIVVIMEIAFLRRLRCVNPTKKVCISVKHLRWCNEGIIVRKQERWRHRTLICLFTDLYVNNRKVCSSSILSWFSICLAKYTSFSDYVNFYYAWS